jgi:S-adenosylmethionine decarboxylase
MVLSCRPVKLAILLAAFDGCDPGILDDAAHMEVLVRRMVDAGRFTLFSVEMTHFSPQGVTGVAVVGESHVALHSWPEERRLFVDIASCTTRSAALAAIEWLKGAIAYDSVTVSEVEYTPELGFRGARDR